MTHAELIALIDSKGGDNKVLCIICDNAMNVIYTDGRTFDRATDLFKDSNGGEYLLEHLKLDWRNPADGAHTYVDSIAAHPIDCVQVVLFVTDAKYRTNLDRSQLIDIAT